MAWPHPCFSSVAVGPWYVPCGLVPAQSDPVEEASLLWVGGGLVLQEFDLDGLPGAHDSRGLGPWQLPGSTAARRCGPACCCGGPESHVGVQSRMLRPPYGPRTSWRQPGSARPGGCPGKAAGGARWSSCSYVSAYAVGKVMQIVMPPAWPPTEARGIRVLRPLRLASWLSLSTLQAGTSRRPLPGPHASPPLSRRGAEHASWGPGLLPICPQPPPCTP